MAELGFTKISSNNELDNRAMMVWLWDCGPPKPQAPLRPKPPKGQEGEPEYDLGMIEFREQMADYEVALKTYRAQKAEHTDFEKRYGGPFEVYMWSVDATDALTNDNKAVEQGKQAARRWYISSRTPGWGHLKNKGLPDKMKPGHGHAENLRREQESHADLAALKRADPVFGATENAR
jgi:hypothetical protein